MKNNNKDVISAALLSSMFLFAYLSMLYFDSKINGVSNRRELSEPNSSVLNAIKTISAIAFGTPIVILYNTSIQKMKQKARNAEEDLKVLRAAETLFMPVDIEFSAPVASI